MHILRLLSCGAILFLAAPLHAQSDASEPDETYFLNSVIPVLEANCIRCHGEKRQRGDLRLDSHEAFLFGSENGLILETADLESSRILEGIRREGEFKMPPKKPLDADSVAVLVEWVRRGAPWPEGVTLEDKSKDDEEDPVILAKSVPKSTYVVTAVGPEVSFNNDVMPLLSDNCYACHGPDANKREAGLRLDIREGAFGPLKSDRVAVVPGDLAASQLFQRISATSEEDKMPPSDFHKQLDQDEIELLGRWILQGAPWEGHWAFTAPVRSPLPKVAQSDWPENPIDSFVLSRLESEKLNPAEQANRRTLIRRLTFDLTGLPPTLEEVHNFLADDRADAYDRLVDRLLASPRYGEHMARYWLDAARYADTNGYHIDNMRFMWPWRDWVIKSFNYNTPFDVFTEEQLAGDLIVGATPDQRIATGFNRNHMVNFEGGAIPEEYRTQYVMDRLDTTSTVWMGLTVHCAQCHEHKFDPISQEEFYGLAAFFNTIQEEGLDGRNGNAAPFVEAPLPGQRERRVSFETRLKQVDERLTQPPEEVKQALEDWQDDWHARLQQRWTTLRPDEATSSSGAILSLQPDDSVLASGDSPDKDSFVVKAQTTMRKVSAIRLEALLDDSLPERGPGRGENSNFLLTDFELEIMPLDAPDKKERVRFVRAFADHDQEDLEIAKAIDDKPETGWSAEGMRLKEKRTALFVATKPFGFEQGTRLRFVLRHESEYPKRTTGRFRLSLSNDPDLSASSLGTWHANGPYPEDSVEEAHDRRFAAEKSQDLTARYDDGSLKWSRFTSKSDPLTDEPAALYLHREIESASPRTLRVTIRTEQRVKIWVNGTLQYEDADPRKGDATRRTIDLPLHAGTNTLLAKLSSPKGTFALTFTPLDEYSGDVPTVFQLALAEPSESRNTMQKLDLRLFYLEHNWNNWDRYTGQRDRLNSLAAALKKEIPTSMVMSEMATPRKTFFLERGQYDAPGDEVQPGTPAFLPPLPDDMPANRLAFAKWLTDPKHPLTSRVTVNRFWQQFMGRGIVESSEDFGTQGSRPSHPELLDWLATEFVESDWDMKALVRLIVTSSTYRQSARPSAEALQKDPENLLYARGPRYRMDAEMVRDNALALGGLLVETVGGPSVYPYQPPGLWKEVAYGANFSAQTFAASTGEGLYRRSMYTFWKRTSPPPSMMIFDAPNRETCSVRRARSNTPLQALALMNDPQFVEAARSFAQRVMHEGGATPDQKIAYAFEAATARPPAQDEIAILLDVYSQQLAQFESDSEAAKSFISIGDSKPDATLPAPELAAWTTVTSTILNLDETITKG